MGTPVDVRIAGDGSIFITEDRNGTVLRLAQTAKIK
jgi:glucose/arabinose dehydrogenase